MDFNDLFTEIGGFGKYQQLMLWFVLLPAQLPYLCQVYCHLFMSITPDHWCKVSLLDKWNVTDQFSRHLFVPKKDNILHSLQYEQCFVYNITYQTLATHTTQIGWIPNNLWPITKCSEGWVYNRSLLGGDDSIITEWDLVCDREVIQTIPIVVFFFGGFLGLIFGNIFSIKFGKKMTYFLMLFLQCLFGSLIAITDSFEMFCVLRFGVGFSTPNIASIPKSLSLELTPQHKRAKVLLLSELWRNFGALLLVIVSYLIRDFRHLSVAISFPFLVFFFYCWLFPESLKWLVVNERIDSVDRLVRDIASTNVKLLSPDFSIALRRRIRIECALQSELRANQNQNHFLLIKLLFSPNLRIKVITLCFLYITHSLTDIGFTYYIIQFSESRGNGDIYFPFLISIGANYFGLLIARITLKRFGRKYTTSFGDILSAFFSFMSAFVKNKDINLCIIYFASAKVFQSSSLNCLFIWSHELLSLSHFHSVINFCEILSQLTFISIPIIIFISNKREIMIGNGITLSLCLSVFAFLLLISGLIGFTLPDTNDQKEGENSKWKQMFETNIQKKCPKNGILKNKGQQVQSPILSLIRKQEMIRQNESEFEFNDKICESIESPNNANNICTIRVTVL